MKTTKRLVKVLCPTCFGSGTVARNGSRVVCEQCKGKGEIEKVLNEVHSEEGGASA